VKYSNRPAVEVSPIILFFLGGGWKWRKMPQCRKREEREITNLKV
jgi:hypothetical protein